MRLTLFGAGRVGGSMAHYARALGCEVSVVTRKMAEDDRPAAARLIISADIVAAAIPDDGLNRWVEEWRKEIGDRQAIHFSGALTVDGAQSYHPLYSFPKEPLSPSVMGRIAIAREEGAPPFSDLLPGAANPEFVVKGADRPFYHALAVLSGNFAAHLWNETASAFADRFDLAPETVMTSYLVGVVDRFQERPLDSLTGPVARRDRASVAANLDALAAEPRLKALYEAFLASAWPDWTTTPEKGGAKPRK
ncbi:MAG: DUF2520 domain-containing protein [Parvularculaceae bacterium]